MFAELFPTLEVRRDDNPRRGAPARGGIPRGPRSLRRASRGRDSLGRRARSRGPNCRRRPSSPPSSSWRLRESRRRSRPGGTGSPREGLPAKRVRLSARCVPGMGALLTMDGASPGLRFDSRCGRFLRLSCPSPSSSSSRPRRRRRSRSSSGRTSACSPPTGMSGTFRGRAWVSTGSTPTSPHTRPGRGRRRHSTS